jgi:type IV secretion system protein VirB3
MSEKAKYPSYNGLSRVAMFWGVPLMAIVVIATACLLIGAIAAAFLGVGGILFAAIGFPFLLYLKQICETDDQALRITLLEIQCRLSRRNGKQFGNTYTLSPIQFGRREHVYQRYFIQPTRK